MEYWIHCERCEVDFGFFTPEERDHEYETHRPHAFGNVTVQDVPAEQYA
jgi:hypothetical protein